MPERKDPGLHVGGAAEHREVRIARRLRKRESLDSFMVVGVEWGSGSAWDLG